MDPNESKTFTLVAVLSWVALAAAVIFVGLVAKEETSRSLGLAGAGYCVAMFVLMRAALLGLQMLLDIRNSLAAMQGRDRERFEKERAAEPQRGQRANYSGVS
jgi:hypothetical protein